MHDDDFAIKNVSQNKFINLEIGIFHNGKKFGRTIKQQHGPGFWECFVKLPEGGGDMRISIEYNHYNDDRVCREVCTFCFVKEMGVWRQCSDKRKWKVASEEIVDVDKYLGL
jgi:hypothetical protein